MIYTRLGATDRRSAYDQLCNIPYNHVDARSFPHPPKNTPKLLIIENPGLRPRLICFGPLALDRQARGEPLLGGLEIGLNVLPIDHIPPRSHVVGTLVLVLEVVGVLPDRPADNAVSPIRCLQQQLRLLKTAS